MEKTKELGEKDFLILQKNACLQEIVKHNIDIKVLERTSPKTVVLKQKLSDHSHREITAEQMLADLRNKLEGYALRMSAIENLLKK